MQQVWTEVLGNGTMAAAAAAALHSAGLDAAAAEAVPHWLMEPAAQRRSLSLSLRPSPSLSVSL